MVRESKSRNWKRSCGCLVGVLSILFVGFILALWQFTREPISNATINKRVLQRLERMTGLAVSYDEASLNIPAGQYHIRNLRLSDPVEGGATFLQIEDVYAKVKPWELLLEPEANISSVILKRPTALDFEYSANSLKLGTRTQILVDAVKAAQPPGTSTAELLPFDNLDIRDVELAFSEAESIFPDDRPPTATLRLTGDMHVENRPGNNLAFDFEGMAAGVLSPADDSSTTGSMAMGVKGQLEIDPGKQFTLSGSVQELALYDLFRAHQGGSLLGRGLEFDLSSSSTETIRSVAATINMENLSTADPITDFMLTDENMAFVLVFDQDTSGGVTRIDRAALRSDGAVLSVNGTAGMENRAPWYELAVAGSALDAEYRAILKRFLPDGWDLDPTQGQLAYDINVSVRNGELGRLDGLVQTRGVNLRTPSLPASLRNLFGDVQFGADSITFSDVTADYGGARLALDGRFVGDPWQDKSGKLDMNWTAIVDVENLLRLHGGRLTSGGDIAASGQISGRGTWEQEVDLRQRDASGVPAVEGGFNFENITLNHPLLPGRVTELSGSAVVDDDHIVLRNLTGKLRGNEMEIDGMVQGDTFFWRDPQVSASLTSRLDLGQLQDYLTDEQERAIDAYNLSGRAETRMMVSGPMADLGSHLTGVMRLEDVGLDPNLSFMNGRVEGVRGAIRWNGQQLDLQSLEGQINGEPLQLSGLIAGNKLDLKIKSPGTLENVARTFPELSQFMDMSGGLMADLRFVAEGSNAPSGSANLEQVMQQAHILMTESVKTQTFTLQGNLELNDASIRVISMPPARRENGRRIPEGRVTGMTGTVVVDGSTLTIPAGSPIRCAFSDTPNCRLSGQLRLRPDNLPALSIQLSTHETLKLDTWVAGWGRELDRPDRPPMTGKTFELDADIQAPRVELRGQTGGRSRGKLSFRMVQNEQPRVTEFHEVVVQGYAQGTGRIIGSGRVESFYWRPNQFPKWQANVDVQSMPLETVLPAVFVAPSNIRGLANGHLTVEGVGDNPLSIRGGGSVYVNNMELGRTGVIQQLGQTTGRDLGGRLFETAQAATFQIGNGALSSRDIVLQTNGLQLDMQGDYWFAANPARGTQARTIDGSLRLRLFKTVFGNLPIIGQVAELADEVTNAFLLAFRVAGPAANPRITPVPLPMFQGA